MSRFFIVNLNVIMVNVILPSVAAPSIEHENEVWINLWRSNKKDFRINYFYQIDVLDEAR